MKKSIENAKKEKDKADEKKNESESKIEKG